MYVEKSSLNYYFKKKFRKKYNNYKTVFNKNNPSI